MIAVRPPYQILLSMPLQKLQFYGTIAGWDRLRDVGERLLSNIRDGKLGVGENGAKPF
jgi:hypothetical protein